MFWIGFEFFVSDKVLNELESFYEAVARFQGQVEAHGSGGVQSDFLKDANYTLVASLKVFDFPFDLIERKVRVYPNSAFFFLVYDYHLWSHVKEPELVKESFQSYEGLLDQNCDILYFKFFDFANFLEAGVYDDFKVSFL